MESKLGRRQNLNHVNFLYLHGFASGPGSTKAQYFLAQFQELGIELHIPDLNQPSFADITVSSRLGPLSACSGVFRALGRDARKRWFETLGLEWIYKCSPLRL